MTPNDPGWNAFLSPDPGPRMNATFVTLPATATFGRLPSPSVRLRTVSTADSATTWVFLNDKPFDETFKKVTSSLVSGKTHYGLIPKEH